MATNTTPTETDSYDDLRAQALDAATTKVRRIRCPTCKHYYGGIARHIPACDGETLTPAIESVER